MSGYGQKIQKVMVQPINLVFRFFQKKLRVQVWPSVRVAGISHNLDSYRNVIWYLIDLALRCCQCSTWRDHHWIWWVHEPCPRRRWRDECEGMYQKRLRQFYNPTSIFRLISKRTLVAFCWRVTTSHWSNKHLHNCTCDTVSIRIFLFIL